MAQPPFVSSIADAAFADGATGTLNLAVAIAPDIQADVAAEFRSRAVVRECLTREQAACVQRWAGSGARLRFVPSYGILASHPDLSAIRSISVQVIQRRLCAGSRVLLLSSTYAEWRDFRLRCPNVVFEAAFHMSGPKDQARWLKSVSEARAEDNEELLASGLPQQLADAQDGVEFRGSCFYQYSDLAELRCGYDMLVCVDGVLDFHRNAFDVMCRRVSGGRALFTMHYAPELLELPTGRHLQHPWFKHVWSRDGRYLTMNNMDGTAPYTHVRKICKSWWRHNVNPAGLYEAVYANAGYGSFEYFGAAQGLYQACRLSFYPHGWLRLVDVVELLQFNRWVPFYVDGQKYEALMRYLMQIVGSGGDFDVAKAYGYIRGNLGQVSTTTRLISDAWYLAGVSEDAILTYAALDVSLARAEFAETFRAIGKLMREMRQLSWVFRNFHAPIARLQRRLDELFNGKPLYDVLREYRRGWSFELVRVDKLLTRTDAIVMSYTPVLVSADEAERAAEARDAFDAMYLRDFNKGLESHAAKKLRLSAFDHLRAARLVYHYGWQPGGQAQELSRVVDVICVTARTPMAPGADLQWHTADIAQYCRGHLNLRKPSTRLHYEVADTLHQHACSLPKRQILFFDVADCSGWAHDGSQALCEHPHMWLSFAVQLALEREHDVTIKVNAPDLDEVARQLENARSRGLIVEIMSSQASNPASFEVYVRLRRYRWFQSQTKAELALAFWRHFQLVLAYHRQRESWVADVLEFGHAGQISRDGPELDVPASQHERPTLNVAVRRWQGETLLFPALGPKPSDVTGLRSALRVAKRFRPSLRVRFADEEECTAVASAEGAEASVVYIAGAWVESDNLFDQAWGVGAFRGRFFVDRDFEVFPGAGERACAPSRGSRVEAPDAESDLFDDDQGGAASEPGSALSDDASVGSAAPQTPPVIVAEQDARVQACSVCGAPAARVCQRCVRARAEKPFCACKPEHATEHDAWHQAGGRPQPAPPAPIVAYDAVRIERPKAVWPGPSPGWVAQLGEGGPLEDDYLFCSIDADGDCAARAAAALVHGDSAVRPSLRPPRNDYASVVHWLQGLGLTVIVANSQGGPCNVSHATAPPREMPFGLIWMVDSAAAYHCHVLVRVATGADAFARQHPYVRKSRVPAPASLLDKAVPLNLWTVMTARPREIYEAFATQLMTVDFQGRTGGPELEKIHKAAADTLLSTAVTLPSLDSLKRVATRVSLYTGAPGARKTETAIDLIHASCRKHGGKRTLYIAPSAEARLELQSRYQAKYCPDARENASAEQMGFYAKTFAVALATSTKTGYSVPNGLINVVIVDEVMRWNYYYLLILAGMFPNATFVLMGDPQQLDYDSNAQWALPDVQVYVSDVFLRRGGHTGPSFDLEARHPEALFVNPVTSRFGPRLVAFLRSQVGGGYELFCDNVKPFDVEVVAQPPRGGVLYMAASIRDYMAAGLDRVPVTIASAQGRSVPTAAVLADKTTAPIIVETQRWPAARLVALTRAERGLQIVTLGMPYWPAAYSDANCWLPRLRLGKPVPGSYVGGEQRTAGFNEDTFSRNFTPEPGSGVDGPLVRVIQPEGRFSGVEYWHLASDARAASVAVRAPTEIFVSPLARAPPLSSTPFNPADLWDLEHLPDGTPFVQNAVDVDPKQIGPVWVKTPDLPARNFEARPLLETNHGLRHHSRSERQLLQTVMVRVAAAKANGKRSPSVPGRLISEMFTQDLCDPVALQELMETPFAATFSEEAANEFRAKMKPHGELKADFTLRDASATFGVFLKAQMKPADFGKTYTEAKYGQPIVTADKSVQFVYGHIARVAKKVFECVLRPQFRFVAGYTEDQLAGFWAAAPRDGWVLMSDYTGFDTTHTRNTNAMLLAIYCLVVPGGEAMHEYFDVTYGARASNGFLRFFAEFLGSGTPWTWLQNTLLQLVFMALAGRAGPMGRSWWQAVHVALIGGDDNTASLSAHPFSVFKYSVVNVWLNSPIKLVVRKGNLGEFGNWLFQDGICCYGLEKLIKKVMNKNLAQVLVRDVEWDAYILGLRNVMMQYRREPDRVAQMNAAWHDWPVERASSLAISVDAFAELDSAAARRVLSPHHIFYSDCAD